MSRERDQLLDRLDIAQAKFRKAHEAHNESRGKGKLKEAAAWKAFRAADKALESIHEELQAFINKHRNKNIH